MRRRHALRMYEYLPASWGWRAPPIPRGALRWLVDLDLDSGRDVDGGGRGARSPVRGAVVSVNYSTSVDGRTMPGAERVRHGWQETGG